VECVNIEIVYKTSEYSRNRQLLYIVCITYCSAFFQPRKLVQFLFKHFGLLVQCIYKCFEHSVYYLKVASLLETCLKAHYVYDKSTKVRLVIDGLFNNK